MASQQPPMPKQIAVLRRRANLTRKEFFDHHYQIHGSIADSPTNLDEKPEKYIQTHFFDAAFGERPGSLSNTGNQPWVGRDDMAELYFRDWNHLKACFGSEHVRTNVGPDGVNFADLEVAIPVMVVEKPLSFNTSLSSTSQPEEGYGTVAVLFLATTYQGSEEELEKITSPVLLSALEQYASNEVWSVQANVGIPASQFDVRAYFGGKDMPEYPIVYKIFIKDSSSVTAVRKAQKAFMESLKDHINPHNTFIVFGKEVLVMDVGKGVKFDKKRQPQLLDIVTPSHLDA